MSEWLTTSEVAAILKVSTDTVLRHAQELGGVCIFGQDGSLRRRRYRTMRFQKSAVEQFLSKRAGHTVIVQTINLKDFRGRDAKSSSPGYLEIK
jgi:hypothetical protein